MLLIVRDGRSTYRYRLRRGPQIARPTTRHLGSRANGTPGSFYMEVTAARQGKQRTCGDAVSMELGLNPCNLALPPSLICLLCCLPCGEHATTAQHFNAHDESPAPAFDAVQVT